jgi:hypothetical protein
MEKQMQTNIMKEMQDANTLWAKLASEKNITVYNVVERALIKAIRAKNTNKVGTEEIALALLQKAFTPITNQNKLANGRWEFDTLREALWYVGNSCKYTLLGHPGVEVLEENELKAFQSLASSLLKMTRQEFIEALTKEYVFTFVRQDLSNEQQMVQAGHSLFKLGCSLPRHKGDKTYFVIVGVPNLNALKEAADHIGKHVEFENFIEPDIGDEMTAISTYPIPAAKKHVFSQYEKLIFVG